MDVTKGHWLFLWITLKNTKTAQKEQSGYEVRTLKNILAAKLSQIAMEHVQPVIFQGSRFGQRCVTPLNAVRTLFPGTVVTFLPNFKSVLRTVVLRLFDQMLIRDISFVFFLTWVKSFPLVVELH